MLRRRSFVLEGIFIFTLLAAPAFFALSTAVWADELESLRASLLIQQQQETNTFIKWAFGIYVTASGVAAAWLTKELTSARKELTDLLRKLAKQQETP